MFNGSHDFIDIREIQFRIYTLTVQVQGQSHDIDITGALAVSKQGSFNTICPGNQTKLGCRHSAASIVVRVETQGNRIAFTQVSAHPFNLIRMHIRGRHFYRCRQIQNDGPFWCRLPDVGDCITNLDRVVKFSPGKTLRRIFEQPISVCLLRSIFRDNLRTVCSDLLDAVTIQIKNHSSLQSRCRIVQMHDCSWCTFERFE